MDNEPRAKVQIEFNQSTTGKGEGYRIAVTDEATPADVIEAHRNAEQARRLCRETLNLDSAAVSSALDGMA